MIVVNLTVSIEGSLNLDNKTVSKTFEVNHSALSSLYDQVIEFIDRFNSIDLKAIWINYNEENKGSSRYNIHFLIRDKLLGVDENASDYLVDYHQNRYQ